MKTRPVRLSILLAALALIIAPRSRAAVTAGELARFHFAEATIEQLQAQMKAGELTAHALTSAYLARITAIDRAGPTLRAVIEINPDALTIARQLDAERAAGKVRGPLHGIPVLIKDNIATADRMETTAGSLALVGSRPPRDAAVVTRLRAAGAVILGKTNLSEWANFRGNRSVSGWSARGGQTRNPYALDRNPYGSSSGFAAAVSANLCVVAIGTENVGSIISPSSACGVVGFKPTVGLLGRSGFIPISSTLFHPQRANRLLQQHAHDPQLPGLEELITRTLDATWRQAAGADHDSRTDLRQVRGGSHDPTMHFFRPLLLVAPAGRRVIHRPGRERRAPARAGGGFRGEDASAARTQAHTDGCRAVSRESR